MHAGVPTVVLRNMCISLHCVFSAYETRPLYHRKGHITANALSISHGTPEYFPVSLSRGCGDNLSLAITIQTVPL